jgi:hypothetical protein
MHLSVCMYVCVYVWICACVCVHAHIYAALNTFLKCMWRSYSCTTRSDEMLAAIFCRFFVMMMHSEHIASIRDCGRTLNNSNVKDTLSQPWNLTSKLLTVAAVRLWFYIIDIFFYHFFYSIILLLGYITSLNPRICPWSQACHQNVTF